LAAVTTDFLGAPRPATGVDIGAFQFGAVAPTDAGAGPPADGGSTPTTEAGSPSVPDASAPEDAAASPDGAASANTPGPDATIATTSGKGSPGCSCSETGHTKKRPPGGAAALVVTAVALTLRGKRREARAAQN
jgi:hypothetical protein